MNAMPPVRTGGAEIIGAFSFMLQIGGLVVLFGCVFGGYLMTGGSLAVVFEALPHEMLTIMGAAIAAMLIAGSMFNMKKIFGSIGQVISGPRWKPSDYRDLLCLLFLLTKTMKSKGLIALEAHIEKPSESSIFKRYPKICKDHFALDFICDTLRMMTMSLEDPHQVETNMEKQLEAHHHVALVGASALAAMADGLPALGIVAAVLGVIKTMGAISEPPEVLGGMIGSALVGTFMGVFMAYGIVGPMGQRLKAVVDEDSQFYHVIRDILVAHLHGNAAQVSVEIGRGSVPSEYQPSFQDMEKAISAIPPDGG
jgi:chemotaxis protein MotA